jgi:hypothetical protein
MKEIATFSPLLHSMDMIACPIWTAAFQATKFRYNVVMSISVFTKRLLVEGEQNAISLDVLF